jgi:hypothetical protein
MKSGWTMGVVVQASEIEGNKILLSYGLRRLLSQSFYHWKIGCGGVRKFEAWFVTDIHRQKGLTWGNASFPGRNGENNTNNSTTFLVDTQCLHYDLLAYSDIRDEVHLGFPPAPSLEAHKMLRNTKPDVIKNYFQNFHSCRFSCTPTPTRASIASSSSASRNFC